MRGERYYERCLLCVAEIVIGKVVVYDVDGEMLSGLGKCQR